ncbi:MAG: hypothetical protein KGJ72_09500 [Gammaproteobacteria bacterium]|nr:hypothetical protein [Gammaproteobacteria bacterium]
MFGYVLSAAIYGLLLVGCVTVWRRRLSGSALPAACAAQLSSSVIFTVQDAGGNIAPGVMVASQYLHGLVWCAVLVRCLESSSVGKPVPRGLRALSTLIAVLLLGTFACIEWSRSQLVEEFARR